jgi:DNA anti-recombination protein RmuC
MLESYAESFDKLGTHLRNAQKSYEDADSKLARARTMLGQMAQGALPEGAAAAEPAQLSFKAAGKV